MISNADILNLFLISLTLIMITYIFVSLKNIKHDLIPLGIS